MNKYKINLVQLPPILKCKPNKQSCNITDNPVKQQLLTKQANCGARQCRVKNQTPQLNAEQLNLKFEQIICINYESPLADNTVNSQRHKG